MNEDGNAAVFVGTLLDSGDSVTLCPPCLVGWAVGIVEGGTGLPVSDIIAEAQRQLDSVPGAADDVEPAEADGEGTDAPKDVEADTPEDSTASDQ